MLSPFGRSEFHLFRINQSAGFELDLCRCLRMFALSFDRIGQQQRKVLVEVFCPFQNLLHRSVFRISCAVEEVSIYELAPYTRIEVFRHSHAKSVAASFPFSHAKVP